MDSDFITAILLILFIIGILVVICLAPFVKFSQVGRGEHSGYITAIDQRGYIFRNYDVYFKTDNSSSQEDTYCIHRDDTALLDKAFKANKTRKQVTLIYEGVRGIGMGLCGHTQIKSIE